MRQIPYILFFVSLFSCGERMNNSTADKQDNPDSVKRMALENPAQPIPSKPVEIDPANIECVATPYYYGSTWSNFSPGAFHDTTLVYSSTKPDAIVSDTLRFKTPVVILAEYPQFFLICSGQGKRGYVKKTDLFLHAQFWGLKSATYFFGLVKYGSADGTSCKSSKLKVVKVDKKNDVVNTYYDSIYGNEYELKLIYNAALKNAEAVFFLDYDCYQEIGVSAQHFIVDNGERLSRLVMTSSSGDGGFSDISTIYLPVRLTHGEKIVLAKNGVLSMDERTLKPEIYAYPANAGVPIEELIIVEDKTTEEIYDETTGKLKVNADGTVAQNISNMVTTYYRWNGSTLQKVKTIK